MKVVIKCNKCKKEAKKDKTKSNKNWNVFKTSDKCSCGGTFEPVIIK